MNQPETKRLIVEIVNMTSDLMPELEKAAEGNKSAARRARKLTLDLGKKYLDFRKQSV